MSVCRREIEKALKPLLKYAYVLTRDSDLACELVQDCVVKALNTRTRPASDASYRPWLFSILRNVFLDYLRRNRRMTAYHQDIEDVDNVTGIATANVEDGLINRISVQTAMDKLAGPYREILALVDIAGFSYAETAELLGVPKGTVMSRLSRARQNLLAEVSTHNIHALEPVRKIRDLKAGQ